MSARVKEIVKVVYSDVTRSYSYSDDGETWTPLITRPTDDWIDIYDALAELYPHASIQYHAQRIS